MPSWAFHKGSQPLCTLSFTATAMFSFDRPHHPLVAGACNSSRIPVPNSKGMFTWVHREHINLPRASRAETQFFSTADGSCVLWKAQQEQLQ